MLSCPVLPYSETPWTVAHQPLVSVRVSMPKYWSGLPFLPPGDLPHPGIEPTSPTSLALQADSTAEPPWKPIYTSIPHTNLRSRENLVMRMCSAINDLSCYMVIIYKMWSKRT